MSWVPEETFGARLVMVRRCLGWNIKEAAARTGLDDGSWSNWERGASPRDKADIVERIAAATGADREWLMWGTPSARATPAKQRSGSSLEAGIAA